MKKLLILSLVALAMQLPCQASTEIDGIYYKLNSSDKTAEVTYYAGSYSINDSAFAGSLIIPSTVEYKNTNYVVTSIGYRAFYGCKSLVSVTIPESITSIGSQIFYNCTSLPAFYVDKGNEQYCSKEGVIYSKDMTELVLFPTGKEGSFDIPNSVTSIESYAFWDCRNLAQVTIPNSVTSIGSYAFENCISLTQVTIPNSVTNMGDNAFSRCSSLVSVSIPESVTSIGNSVFYGCSSLVAVTIPNTVTSIEDSAFYGCSSLTEVAIGESVTSIGNSAFYNCSSLAELKIPESVTSIGSSAFYLCSSLAAVTIPNSVTSIGSQAFRYCSSLVEVTIGESVASIDFYVFEDCISLVAFYVDEWNGHYCSEDGVLYSKGMTELIQFPAGKIGSFNIPEGVTSIGEDAFSGCTSLTAVTIPNSVTSIGGSAFSGCSSLAAVSIPNSVTSLEYSTFQECSSLTQVTIGNSVTSIGYRAFYGCCSLIEIYSANPTPPSVNSSYTFSGVDNEACTLYVPEGCVDAYSCATYWSDFLNIHEYDVTSVQGVRGTEEKQVISINSFDGKQVSALQRGINIIRYSDGTVKKELVK